MKLCPRMIEGLNKSSKYLWDVLKTDPTRLVYISGNPASHNLGDYTLFMAYKKLFNRCNFVRYWSGGRMLSIPTKLLRVSGSAMLAGGTLINRWGLNAARECVDLFPKSYVFGTGVAQSYFWSRVSGWKDTLQQWKSVLVKCDYVGVRGPLSAEALTDIGIHNVEVIGDAVLAYAEDECLDSISYSPNSIGLNIGQSLSNIWGSEETVCAEFIKLAKIAKNNGWTLRWFVVWPEDLPITQKAAALSNTKEHIHQIYKDSSRYLELVRSLSVFVGMKLHAVILATCAYVPSIMLEYRPKCRDYMMSIGQTHNTIRTDKFKAEEVWDIICDWNTTRVPLSKTLYQCMKPLREKQRAKAEELMRIIQEHQ